LGEVRDWDRLHLRIEEVVKTKDGEEIREHVLLNAARDELEKKIDP
jgi:hypothetical protein